MTATATAYRSPYVSEVLGENDGTLNDCAVATTIMLVGDWTLGEGLTRPDGRPKDVLWLREWVRRQLGPDAQDGGLTLHDADQMARLIDPDLPPMPRYGGQALRSGQSSDGATLRLTWDEFMARIRTGHSAALCGNPIGVKDAGSPLRQAQNNDDYPHVIHVTDGNATSALVKDPLTRHHTGYPGERVSWSDLRQFTEAKKGNDRQFGSPTAIACAVIKVGDETEAERIKRAATVQYAKLAARTVELRAQVTLATDERDQARRDLAAANARTDCAAQVTAERARVLDAIRAKVEELV